jgi:hypothetical protein
MPAFSLDICRTMGRSSDMVVPFFIFRELNSARLTEVSVLSGHLLKACEEIFLGRVVPDVLLLVQSHLYLVDLKLLSEISFVFNLLPLISHKKALIYKVTSA